MTFDDLVRRRLATVADEIRPAPDPLGRLLARRRRRQRSRTVVIAVGLVLVAVAVGSMLRPARPDSDAGADRWQANYLAWQQRLVDSPPRGAVAADPLFVAEFGALPRPGRVLFADDVGPMRVAYVASRGWMTGPRGAHAADLTDAPPTPDLGPFAVTIDGNTGVSVGLAPAGCQVDSAPLPAADDWQPEPTGSYVVRTPANHRPEWWRVTCEGMVRYTVPAPVQPDRLTVGDANLDRARGGPVDRTGALSLLHDMAVMWGYSVTATPSLIWTGVLPGTGRTTVVAAPLVGGGWAGEVDETGVLFHGVFDPAGPLAVRLDASTVLVIAPHGATAVRAVYQGRQIDRADVRNDAAVLSVTDREGMVVEVVDGTGTVLARVSPARPGFPMGVINRWGD